LDISDDSLWEMEHGQAVARWERPVRDVIGQDLGIVAAAFRIGQAAPKQQEMGAREESTLLAIINWKTPGALEAVSARNNAQACPRLDMNPV